jgi:hypothetical protein
MDDQIHQKISILWSSKSQQNFILIEILHWLVLLKAVNTPVALKTLRFVEFLAPTPLSIKER